MRKYQKLYVENTLIKAICDGEIRASKKKPYGYHIIYQLNYENVIKCYFSNNSDGRIGVLSGDQASVLMLALKYERSYNVISFLLHQEEKLGRTISIDYLDACNRNIFHYAAIYCKDAEIINLLIDRFGEESSKAALQQEAYSGDSPVELAIKHDNRQAISAFSKAGFVYESKHLLLACRKKKNSIARRIVRSYRTQDRKENTGNYEKLINEKGFRQETSLHIAVSTGNVQLSNFLLNQGADINELNEDKLTPLQLAIKKRHYLIVATIARHMRDNNQGKASSKTNTAVSSEKVGALLLYMSNLSNRDSNYTEWFGCIFGWFTSHVLAFNFSKQQKMTAAGKNLCFWLDREHAPTLTQVDRDAMFNGKLRAVCAA